MKAIAICAAFGISSCVIAEIWPSVAWIAGWIAGILYMAFTRNPQGKL